MLKKLKLIYYQLHKLWVKHKLTSKKKRLSFDFIGSFPDTLIITDLNQQIISANQVAQKTFEFNLSKIKKQPLITIFEKQESTQQQIKTILESLNQTPLKSIQREIRVFRSQSKDTTYSLSISPVKNLRKKHIGYLLIFRNISHEKELVELRENFLRTVSHELRSPLTSIMGFISLIAQETLGPVSIQQKEYLHIALNESVNLKNLINDLLDLSKIEAGKLAIQNQKINVQKLLNDLLKSYASIAHIKNIEFSTPFDNSNLFINTDEEKLRRILINLISNAIKFTEKGSVTLHCQETYKHITFTVKDTGIGLLDSEKESIFEKFKQLDASVERKYEGIGLGLSIVKELVEMLGGKIHIKSTGKQGSSFSITLPKIPPKQKKASITQLLPSS